MTGLVEDPERDLILTYAPTSGRAGLEALLALDDALANLLRTTREPALGQMRLAWWREALEKLDRAPAPAEPVLKGLEAEVLRHGVTGASLVPIVHGWEVLIEEEVLDQQALGRYAMLRGGTLFEIAGRLLGASEEDRLDIIGRGWALADLARNIGESDVAETAREMAITRFLSGMNRRQSRNVRALGALAHVARMNLALPTDAPVPHGAPSRVWRLLWHRLTGR